MPAPDPRALYEDDRAPAADNIRLEPFGALASTEGVRAVFGLSDVELPDAMLTQTVYTDSTADRLAKLLGDTATRWATVVASSDPKDVRLVSAVRAWAVYAVADKVCDVLPLVVARTLSDSKASFQRFDVDLGMVVLNIRKRFALAEDALLQALDDARTVNLTRVKQMGYGHPAYDPVTGKGYRA